MGKKALKEGQNNEGFVVDPHDVEAPPAPGVSWIVIDLSSMSNIDPTGSDKIKALAVEYKNVNINLCVAGPSDSAFEKMQRWGMCEGENGVRVFTNVHEAVTTIKHEALTNPGQA
ncbi:uncharacterized protein LOC135937531 [Cloeon dipterum]|uniref:uncharacterized protein LOC135937531 n=1 Tax=Cloeon dipterum TaxID=197152 RepID=UPI0032201F78